MLTGARADSVLYMSPRVLFRTFATAEFITWALLITGLILRAIGVNPAIVFVTGSLHGFVFLSYGAVTIFVWINQRWRASVGVLGLVTTLVPFATLPFELAIDKRGMLDRTWRLGAGGDSPRNWLEHIQAWVLRHAWLSVILGVLAVAVVFTVLLMLGPPVPREG